jgi:hypothetical protein
MHSQKRERERERERRRVEIGNWKKGRRGRCN